MTYQPKPIDVSNIELSETLIALQEKLAENAHEVWSQERIKQGWTYGKKRDDSNKKHPCLVPYEELPESEKHFDRELAMNTLKLIKKLGYEIKER